MLLQIGLSERGKVKMKAERPVSVPSERRAVRKSPAGHSRPRPATDDDPTSLATYKAFISYSHAMDGKLAPAIQRALHQIAKPWYRPRALRVFRDETNLEVNPGLWSSIQAALTASEFFILLASPSAAQSEWVSREVDYWITERSAETLLIVLTDGDISWEPEQADFNWSRTTALPTVLRRQFKEEPRYIDLRWAREPEQLSQHYTRFRQSLTALAAPLHGKAQDELESEDLRQHRRTRLVAWSAGLLLALLTVVSITSARSARRERDAAESERDRAISRRLAAQAVSEVAERRLDRALLLSLYGLQVAPTPEARSALLLALQESPRLLDFVKHHAVGLGTLAFTPNGTVLASTVEGNRLALWQIRNKRDAVPRDAADIPPQGLSPLTAFLDDTRLLTVSTPFDAVTELPAQASVTDLTTGSRQLADLTLDIAFTPRVMSPDGSTLVATDYEGGAVTYSLGTGETKPLIHPVGEKIAHAPLAVSPSGLLAFAGDGVWIWDTQRNEPVRDSPFFLSAASGDHVTSVALSDDDATLATGHEDGTIRLWSVASGEFQEALRGHRDPVFNLAFSRERSLLASSSSKGDKNAEGYGESEDGTMLLWDVASSSPYSLATDVTGIQGFEQMLSGEDRTGGTSRSIQSPDGGTIAVATDDGMVSVRRGRRTLGRFEAGPPGVPVSAVAMAFDQTGMRLAFGGWSGRLAIWEEGIDQPRSVATDLDRPVLALAFSEEGSTLASGSEDGTIRLWEVATGQLLGPPLSRHRLPVTSLVFYDGSSRLLSRDLNRTLYMWDLDPDAHHDYACRRAGRDLDDGERARFLGRGRQYEAACSSSIRGETATTSRPTRTPTDEPVTSPPKSGGR